MFARVGCFLLCVCATALAGPISTGRRDLKAQDMSFDYEDLTWIKKLAAVGDSYSAGIGAGNRLGSLSDPTTWGDWKCKNILTHSTFGRLIELPGSRYDQSYPALVNAHAELGDAKEQGRDFQFESCSGALTKDVIKDQIPLLSANQDVILLSAGGNDAELAHILNSCVYQIFTPSNILAFLLKYFAVGQALKKIGGEDLMKYSLGCNGQLDASQKIIDSPEFLQSITDTIKAALGKLSSSGTLYYTGYARFWDERAADDDWCSRPEHTWSVYLPKIDSVESDILPDFQKPVVLTKDRRLRMNAMVDSVNAKIKSAVAAAGSQAVFVDYDPYIGLVEGRFCAPGTEEPDVKKPDLNFFELDLDDPLGTSPFERDTATAPDGTFEAQINLMAELAYTAGITKDSDIKPANNTNQLQKRGTFVPDGYGRIFHPQVLGHELIANLVVYNIGRRYGEANGIAFPDEISYDDNQCPLQYPLVRPNPICNDTQSLSGVFYNAFHGGPNQNTYDKFCKAITDPQTTFTQTVDIHGDLKQGGSRLVKRTPPPDSIDYSDYSFQLSWVPDKTLHTCLVDCGAAFESLSNSLCGHQGSQQNMMTTEAEIEVGCGTYSWKVEKDTTEPPSLSEQHCFSTDGKKPTVAVDPKQQQSMAAAACSKAASKISPNGQGNLYFVPDLAPPGFYYTINWVGGCDDGLSEMDTAHPLADHPDLDCTTLMINNYKNCNNLGRGGSIQAGCLLYSFWGW